MEKLAKQMAIEAIYSSKGHFRSSDAIGYCLFILVFIPFVTSSMVLVFDIPEVLVRFLSFIGMLFSLFALSYSYASNQSQGKKRSEQHMMLGNYYLDLYSELRQMVMTDSVTDAKLEKVREQMQELNSKTNTCKISFFGRQLSRIFINREVDTKWMYE